MSSSSTSSVRFVRIRISGFDSSLVDRSVSQLISAAKKNGVVVDGAIPLPSKIRRYIVNKSPNRHKRSREQFHLKVSKRMIIFRGFAKDFMRGFSSLKLPAGVDVQVLV